jgi:hypothetical protein
MQPWPIFPAMTSLQRVVLGLIAGAALLGAAFVFFQRPTASDAPAPQRPATALTLDGRSAAAMYCQSCHLLPDPQMLDKRTWREELLPKMRYFVGLTPPGTNSFVDLQVALEANVFPLVPMMSESTWKTIEDYYIAAAPESISSPQDQERITVGLRHFTATPAPFRQSPPLTTMVRIDEALRVIVMADASSQAIHFLDARGTQISSFPLGNIAVSMARATNGFWFSGIGHFFPREEPRGQVLFVEHTLDGLRRHEIVSQLPRTTDVQLADLNGDGLTDFTLSAFGNFVGRFSWFRGNPDGTYTENILIRQPGAIASRIHDFNGDGHPDIAVLVAQATEALYIFMNDGSGRFKQHTIFQRQPSWGHSNFELTDFNGDGQMDLLVTNGDNADFDRESTRPYHGIRIYLNQGDLRFEESFFFHLNGAYKAVARDFDQDGDLDIAAISFFPDYAHSPRESFVYLENLGDLKFSASTFPECIAGRWLTMDVGDLDGDGYEDIVLGSLSQMPGASIPPELKQIWEQRGPSVMILRNTVRQTPDRSASGTRFPPR